MEIASVPKALPQPLEDELRALRNILADLDREHRVAAAPYIERMVRIESLREHSSMVLLSPGEELPQGLKDLLGRSAS